MTELMYPDYLGQAERGYQIGRSHLASRLAGQAYSATGDQQRSLLGQLVGVDPRMGTALGGQIQQQQAQQAQTQQAQEVDHAKKINGAAQYVLQAYQSGKPEAVQGAYQAVRPYLAEITGKEPPPQWDDSMLPGLYQTLAATGGAPQQKGTVVAPGGVLVDSASGQQMYANPAKPAKATLVDVPDGQGGTVKMLFDPALGKLTPPQFGGGQPQGQPQGLDAINARASELVNSGQMTPEQGDAWIKQQYQAAGLSLDGQGPAGGGGLGYNPPKRAQTLSPAELRAAGLPDGTVAQRDTNGKISVVSRPPQVSPDKLADIAAKRQKAQQAQQDSVSTFNDSISKIDSLLNSGNFGELGTFTGDLASKIPHTGAADAKAQLDTIGNQSVINTLSALKSLSATGASGFGALSEKEGDILRNAAANLSTGQSNAALRQNLLDLRTKMVRARDRVAQQKITLPEDGVVQQSSQPAQGGGWAIEPVQ